MSDTSFVRSGMLPPQTPPISERGAVKWLRENLFSGWLNTVLTIISIFVVFTFIIELFLWVFLYSHWALSSLSECRAADAALAPRYGFQLTDLLVLPFVLLKELLIGIFTLDLSRTLVSPKTAIDATWLAMNTAPPAGGACWAMVRERWHQFLFGFYPRDLYWRPVLAMGLMLISLAPVLYFGLRRPSIILVGTVSVLTLIALALIDRSGSHLVIFAVILAGLAALAWFAPKRLSILTIAFPLLGFWLLWGGSVWGPVGVALGFAILVAVHLVTRPFLGVVVGTGLGVVVAAFWWLWVQGIATTKLHALLPIESASVGSDEFGGFLLAFVIGVTAIGASLPIGILLALGRRSDMLLIKTLCVGFIEFVRGVPLITVLFTATLLLGYFLPPQSNFDIVLRVIILVSFFAAAYMAEVIRGGLAALPRGQYEAADALGLDYWQAQRLIIMPQALKVSIPGIVSSFIGLFKDTTLVAFVGLMDPLKGVTTIVRADTNWKGIYWEPYILVGAIFFVVCFGMSRYSMYLERKLKTDHR